VGQLEPPLDYVTLDTGERASGCLLYPSEPVWIDSASNLSRHDPSGAVQSDAELLTRNRKVEDSNLPGLGLRRSQHPVR
jgi:hypothetical protein